MPTFATYHVGMALVRDIVRRTRCDGYAGCVEDWGTRSHEYLVALLPPNEPRMLGSACFSQVQVRTKCDGMRVTGSQMMKRRVDGP